MTLFALQLEKHVSHLNAREIRPGIALVELLIAMGVTAIMMPALITAFFAARGGGVQQSLRLEATALAREAKEALRVVRDAGWEYVETNGIYHPEIAGTTWGLAANQEPIGDFTRQIEIQDAFRDVSGNLTTVPGTVDPSVKRILITVGWDNLLASETVADYYLMRFENLTYIETLLAEFDAGTHTGTTTTNVGGGEVTLGGGGTGSNDWCAPTLTLEQTDLPKSGVANAISAERGESDGDPNQIIAGTGDNASGVSMAYATAADTNPPDMTASPADTFDGYKTNGVFVAGDFAYISTDNNFKEVVIVSLTQRDPGTGKYVEAGAFNAPGNGNSAGVYVVGPIGFATVGAKLYTFDVSNPGSVTQLGSVDLAGAGARLVVAGNYVYVAETSGSRAMEIVEIGLGGATLSVVGWAALGGQNGVDVVVNQASSRAYLATAQGKVYILNTSVPNAGALPSPVGIYDTNGMSPRGVTVVTNNKAIVVGTGGTMQYQVIEIVDETNPILCTRGGTVPGGLAIPSGANGIASVQEQDGDTFSYILTGDASAELKIIQGGSGGEGGGAFADEGTFESRYFDTGRASTFNRFDANITTPVDTTLEFQVAVAAPVAGSCEGAAYNFVGPDRMSTSTFGSSGQIPLGSAGTYTNPGQCLKYRAIMSGNTTNTPTFYDITVNYSP